MLDRDEPLSREDIQAILEAREAKRRNLEEMGAKQLLEVLNAPGSGMSRRFTFNMTGDEDEADDDRPPAA